MEHLPNEGNQEEALSRSRELSVNSNKRRGRTPSAELAYLRYFIKHMREEGLTAEQIAGELNAPISQVRDAAHWLLSAKETKPMHRNSGFATARKKSTS